MLQRAAMLASRRTAAAVRTLKPIPTNVTTVGRSDGASFGISLPEAIIVPKLGEVLCPETYCKVPTIYFDDLNQKVISYSSSIIPALPVAPLTASISPPSIVTGLVGSSSLLEFGGVLPTASIKPSYIPPIVKMLPVAATLKSSYDGQSSSWRPPSKALAVLVALGVVGTLGEIEPSADCARQEKRGKRGSQSACACDEFAILPDGCERGVGAYAGWAQPCRAKVQGKMPPVSAGPDAVGPSIHGVARNCPNFNNFPQLFREEDVKAGATKGSGRSGPSGKADQERGSAFTPWPIRDAIMGVDKGYPRVEALFEFVFNHSDPLSTILPFREDTKPQAAAKEQYRELLAAKIRGEDVLCLDIERVQTTLTKAMRARKDPKGQVIANEATQVGAVVGPLRPDLGKGDVEVILNEGQATPFGEHRVQDIMTTTTSFRVHDDKHIWTFSKFPEKDLLGHLGLGDRFRDFHAVLSIALGMNAQGQHRNKSYEAPCPIASSMPMVDQMINCDLADVVADPIKTTYPHKAARKCLPSADVVDDPTATLQVMGKIATKGLEVLRKRWNEVDAYLLGDDTVTRPRVQTGYVNWYDASEENRKYAAPVNKWPGFDPKKMKPPRSAKRKAKDAPKPKPAGCAACRGAHRKHTCGKVKAKFVVAGSGSGSLADPVDLSNSPSPPKRSRVEALDELE